MKRQLVNLVLGLVLSFTMIGSTTAIQRGGHTASHPNPPVQRPERPRQPAPSRPSKPSHPSHRPDPNRYGRDHHRQFHREDLQAHNGYLGFYIEGFWFESAIWPEWAFSCDIYFVQEDDGQWLAVSYCDPSLIYPIIVE